MPELRARGEDPERLLPAYIQLINLAIAERPVGMRLAMRIVQWLDRPASAFVYAADW